MIMFQFIISPSFLPPTLHSFLPPSLSPSLPPSIPSCILPPSLHRIGCLEINPGTQPSLSISLPKPFLGDKRTSYNQRLTFDLSVQNMVPGDSCHVFVEVVGRLSRYRQITLVAELPCPGNLPQLLEVYTHQLRNIQHSSIVLFVVCCFLFVYVCVVVGCFYVVLLSLH